MYLLFSGCISVAVPNNFPTWSHILIELVAIMELNDFLTPRYPYRGSDQPENMLFNANLQEFAQQVSYIAALQTNGKMSTLESYKKIKQQWKRLKKTHKQLT